MLYIIVKPIGVYRIMKLTESMLRNIIKQELKKVLNEALPDTDSVATPEVVDTATLNSVNSALNNFKGVDISNMFDITIKENTITVMQRKDFRTDNMVNVQTLNKDLFNKQIEKFKTYRNISNVRKAQSGYSVLSDLNEQEYSELYKLKRVYDGLESEQKQELDNKAKTGQLGAFAIFAGFGLLCLFVSAIAKANNQKKELEKGRARAKAAGWDIDAMHARLDALEKAEKEKERKQYPSL